MHNDTSHLDAVSAHDVEIYNNETRVMRRQVLGGELEVRVSHVPGMSGVAAASGGLKATIRTDLEGDLFLHWGINPVGRAAHDWVCPPKALWPSLIGDDTRPVNQHAVETSLHRAADGFSEINLNFVDTEAPPAITFVLKDDMNGRWHNNGGPGWRVPLAESLPQRRLQENRKTIFANVDTLDEAFDEVVGERSASVATATAPTGSRTSRSKHFRPSSIVSAFPWNSQLLSGREEQELVRERFSFKFEVLTEHFIHSRMLVCDNGKETKLEVATNLPGDVYMHWGCSKRGIQDPNGAWDFPERRRWPDNTAMYGDRSSHDRALRTLMAPREGADDGGYVKVDVGLDIAALHFVLHDVSTDQWFSDTNGGNFHVPLPDVIVESKARKFPFCGSTKSSSRLKGATGEEETHIETYRRFDEPPKWRVVVPAIGKRKIEVAPYQHSATGFGDEIILQGFNWESWRERDYYKAMRGKVDDIKRMGFSVVWFPPPTDSVSPHGYMPRDLYDLNSEYGSAESLKAAVRDFRKRGMTVLADCVLNHRCAHYKNAEGVYNQFGGRLDWGPEAIVRGASRTLKFYMKTHRMYPSSSSSSSSVRDIRIGRFPLWPFVDTFS